MMGAPGVSGSLSPWDEVRAGHSWKALLLGNGLSANVWPQFGYRSLYEELEAANAVLSPDDQALFSALDTHNFERVLRSLAVAIQVDQALGLDTTLLQTRYESIQGALGAAVRHVHLLRSQLDEQQLVPIRDELRQHQYVFTTSYDLVIYWAAGCAPAPSFQGFVDFFWSDNINAFNRRWCSVTNAEDTRLFYLHGALHLVVTELGTTRKRVRDTDTLLDRFGTPIDGDPTTRPLLISEGASAEKARAIQENAYLRFALSELQACPEPVVVFGHSLSEQDAHLAEAPAVPGRLRALGVSTPPAIRARARSTAPMTRSGRVSARPTSSTSRPGRRHTQGSRPTTSTNPAEPDWRSSRPRGSLAAPRTC